MSVISVQKYIMEELELWFYDTMGMSYLSCYYRGCADWKKKA